MGQVFWMWFKKCSLYSRRASNQKIVILGVHINETCYKTGRVSTRDFMVVPKNFQGVYKIPKNYFQGVYKVPKNFQGVCIVPKNFQGVSK